MHPSSSPKRSSISTSISPRSRTSLFFYRSRFKRFGIPQHGFIPPPSSPCFHTQPQHLQPAIQPSHHFKYNVLTLHCVASPDHLQHRSHLLSYCFASSISMIHCFFNLHRCCSSSIVILHARLRQPLLFGVSHFTLVSKPITTTSDTDRTLQNIAALCLYQAFIYSTSTGAASV